MSDMLVAQCPHCQTRFRVSQDHLQAAAGNVRCGACLKVFNASAQINVASTEASAPAAGAAAGQDQQPAPAEPSASRHDNQLIHDHLQLDDLDLQALGLDESILEEINPDARTLPPGAELSAHEKTPDSTGEPLLPVNPASLEPATPAPDNLTDQPADDVADRLTTDNLLAADDDAEAEPWFPDFPRRPLADKPPVAALSQDSWKLTEEQIDQAFEFDSAADDPDAWDREFHLDDDLEPTPTPPTLSPAALDDVELHEAFKSAASAGKFAPRPLPTAAPPPITPTPPIAPVAPAPAPQAPRVPTVPTVPTVRTIPTEPTEPTEPTPSIESRQAPLGQDAPAPMRPLTAPPVDHGVFLRDQPPTRPAASPPRQRQPQPQDDPYREPERPQPGRREPSLGGGLSLPDLIDEPLYIDPRPLPRRPRRRWLWVMLSAIAALALIGQIAVYNFATLVHDERTRPMMEQLCFLAGCELPARVSIELIRSSNLVVRPHPDFPNALAIDVILYNRADFAQPFPVLRMTFTDVGGRELGNKLFQPAEYLGGELAGSTLMPPQTPVHVGLSMLNPGPEATSYNLDFLSP